ncbi:response regulator with CheY-like receiver, AAA-type ATPase, and DNA-binding domains [Polaromonas sp. CF318]|nr:response regulator with CheY-like receiver, AAA-type ATPase, and DNA-binding domains [Polaromonas sp. CF318]
MTNTGGEAVKRIFVKVFGFDDVERHALNTVFRLSETRPTAYALWTAAAPEEAELALIDGDSWEAAIELANPAHDDLKLVWIGDNAPSRARLAIKRPLQWAAVIEGMDALLEAEHPQAAGKPAEPELDLDLLSESGAVLDLDLDFDSQAPTAPSPLQEPAAEAEQAQVLVVDADRDARLYLRARLAMAGRLIVDEAASGTEALKLMDTRLYKLVILDMDLPDIDGWEMVKRVEASRPHIEFLILTGSKLTPLDAVRGWFAGARGSLRKPLHPGKLKYLLRSVS